MILKLTKGMEEEAFVSSSAWPGNELWNKKHYSDVGQLDL